jgi:endonuclease III
MFHMARGKIYSQELGIDLQSRRDRELFKWLVACLLFGRPIQQQVAARAFHELEKANLLTPEKLQEAGWQRLVDVLGQGHYVRYDESTATRLLEAAKLLQEKYGGSVQRLLEAAEDQNDLQKRLMEFKGIGPKASSIFMRDIEQHQVQPHCG